jgi:hypothetical protein
MLALILALFAMPHIHFTWNQSQPGEVKILEGTAHGGPYPKVVCKSSDGKCDATGFTPGQTYYFVAQETGIAGYSNEVAATVK